MIRATAKSPYQIAWVAALLWTISSAFISVPALARARDAVGVPKATGSETAPAEGAGTFTLPPGDQTSPPSHFQEAPGPRIPIGEKRLQRIKKKGASPATTDCDKSSDH
jgi:hypothetical protein